MMKKIAMAAFVLAIPSLASAHVTLRPAQSKPAAEERYTVRVPTEGQVATTSLQLEIPAGVTVTDVPSTEGNSPEVTKVGDRIVSITWKKEIPPRQTAEFTFTARNPGSGEQITWKARQNFADGTSRDWTPGTKLVSNPAPAGAMSANAHDVDAWLKRHAAAARTVTAGPRRRL